MEVRATAIPIMYVYVRICLHVCVYCNANLHKFTNLQKIICSSSTFSLFFTFIKVILFRIHRAANDLIHSLLTFNESKVYACQVCIIRNALHFVCLCVYVHVCMCAYVCMCVRTCVCMHACICVCAYMCVCVCVYVCACMHAHIHTQHFAVHVLQV